MRSDGLAGSPVEDPKEGQEDRGTSIWQGGNPLALLAVLHLPVPPSLPSGSSLASPSIHRACKQ